ncbi:MAG: SufD family Fe-S cluster assembly protein [bacterium]|nr:SufD family Fe-S cluster assembly protein [bacterium]
MTNTQTVIPGESAGWRRRFGIQKKKAITEVVDKDSKSKSGDITLHQGQYVFLLTDTAKDFTNERTITIGEGAQVDIFLCYFGSGNVITRNHFKIKADSRISERVIFFATGEQQFSFDEKYEFTGKNAKGEFVINGLVSDNAKSGCAGNIIINTGASGTDARLEMSSYILGLSGGSVPKSGVEPKISHARSEMVPSLEIKNNEVKASHAAKTHNLSGDELFYLSSRGLAPAEAKRLFIEGLFLEFVKNIDSKDVREKILTISKKRYE